MIDQGAAPPVAGGDSEAAPLLVLIVAAYPAVRAGLVALLTRDPALKPMEQTRVSGPGGFGAGAVSPPAVIVIDVASTADAAIDGIGEDYPDIPLALLGGDPAVDGPGLGSGPIAYLAQDVDGPTLAAAVRSVALGLTVIDPAVAGAGLHVAPLPEQSQPTVGGATAGLTARERQVLELVANGLPNKTIARKLGISEHTVKFHVGSVLGKLGAASRTEAVTLATRRGILAV